MKLRLCSTSDLKWISLWKRQTNVSWK